MDISNVVTLILTVLLGAFIGERLFSRFEKNHFKTALTFSGAYLFATTLLHLIPELFEIQQSLVEAGMQHHHGHHHSQHWHGKRFKLPPGVR